MVVADVVPVPGAGIDEAGLVAWCRPRLPEYGVPRRIRFLDQIPAKESLKSDV
jgi:acyl-CoA synthetase (AMP-forming)/AMP-acid ligase II